LDFVFWRESYVGFKFANYSTFNKKVSEVFTYGLIVVAHSYGNLLLHGKAAFAQFKHHRVLINFFEKSKSEFAMYREGAANDLLGDCFVCHLVHDFCCSMTEKSC